jgi:hypothetical protein
MTVRVHLFPGTVAPWPLTALMDCAQVWLPLGHTCSQSRGELCSAVQCSAVQCSAVQCRAEQCTLAE